MVHQLRLKYDSGLTVNELNLKMSQQCAAMKANRVLSCITKAEGWDYYTLLGPCQGIPGVLDRVLSPQLKTVIEKLKNVQQRVTKMITRLKNLTNEERLKEAGLFSLKN